MINLLELTKRQTLTLSAVATGLGIAFVLALGIFITSESGQTKQAFGAQPASNRVENVSDQPVVETSNNEDGSKTETGGSQTVTTYTAPQDATATPAPAKASNKPAQPTPATNPVGETVQGVTDTVRGVTYTLKNVIPGDPMSYVGTYGQCPFYEAVGEKGCWPPSDIVCNADWSICRPKS